jgi:L-aspartate oxidase
MLHSFPDKLPPLLDSAPIIIVGSGIAGLYTALLLSEQYQVILISKNKLSQSNTNYAQGGIAAAIGINDSPEYHYQDTMMAGAGLCDPEAVLTLVYDGVSRIKHLIGLGTPFDRNQAEISLTKEAAHSRRRILHANGDATGKAVSDTLINCIRKTKVQIYEDTYALALVRQQERCNGVVVIRQGNLHYLAASTVVLCTGGLGQIYGKTTNPRVATGDGMALAYNAGASLRDMEFIQFHPTALSLPPAPPFLISEAVRGEGAILLNSRGERFMPHYHTLGELAPRDIVARAIFAEIHKESGSHVFLDLSKIQPAAIKARFPNIYETCLNYGLDITVEPIPVAPAAHYMMGGVITDLWGRTDIPGLYAAGEVAATGVHGANRLASNSLLEGLVFGGRIVDYIQRQELNEPENIAEDITIHYPRLYTTGRDLEERYQFLHHLTDAYLGITRDESGLNEALVTLGSLPEPHDDFELNPAYFELQNMFLLAHLMFQAALTRRESRGGHFRSDYPSPNTTWRKHILFQQNKMEFAN